MHEMPNPFCKFCGDRPEGCLACLPRRLTCTLEYQQAEEQAIRALIAHPRFQEILRKVQAENEMWAEAEARVKHADTRRPADFIEWEPAPKTGAPDETKKKKRKS